MKRYTFVVLAALAALPALAFSMGRKDSGEAVNVSVGVLKGPSGIPMAKMMEDVSSIKQANIEYESYAAAQQLLPKLVKGEVHIGVLPPNVAAKVYSANKGAVVAAAICGNGMLSLISRNSVSSFEDLKGKSVCVAGQGATPEFLFRYLLDKKNIEVGEGSSSVRLDFSIPNADIVPSLIAGKIDYAVVPEPFTTVARQRLGDKLSVINLQEEFAKASGVKDYPMSLIVVNTDFAKSNPKIVKDYLGEYKKAFDWTVANPSVAGTLCEKHDLGLAAAVVEKAVPNANYSYVASSSTEAKKQIEALLKVFLQFDATSIGGKLPDDGFYFK